MTCIANLRATNCTRLLALDETTAAACGPRSVYLLTRPAAAAETRALPRAATSYLPWMTRPGGGAAAVGALCACGGGEVLYLPPGAGAEEGEEGVVRWPTPGCAPEELVAVVGGGRLLAAREGRRLHFFALDPQLPSGAALPAAGGCAFPPGAALLGRGADAAVAAPAGEALLSVTLLDAGAAAVREVSAAPRVPLPGRCLSLAWDDRRRAVLALCGGDGGERLLLTLPAGSWAARPVAEVADGAAAVCCCAGHAWTLGRAAPDSPAAALTHVGSGAAEALGGSSAAAKSDADACGASLFVMVGRSVFWLEMDTAEPPTPGASPAKPRAASAPAPATAGATLADRLLLAAAAASSAPQPAPADAELQAVLAYARTPGAPAPPFVVRDGSYVRAAPPRHAVLDALAAGGRARPTETLRYLRVAHTPHPLTLLLALRPPAPDGEGDPALAVAAARLLAPRTELDPAELRDAARALAAAQAAAGDAEALGMKRLAAVLARACGAALASGALPALRLLATLLDAVVAAVYGAGMAREAALGADGRRRAEPYEREVLAAARLLQGFGRWGLTAAATAIGAVSAHAGEPVALRKEAMLRDGRARPIVTTRTADITPLKLDRPPPSTAAAARGN